MRFGLCCLFWLSFIYASILSQQGFWPRLADPTVVGASKGIGRVEEEVALGAADACRRHPADCLAAVERVRRLLASRPEGPLIDAGGSKRRPARTGDLRRLEQGAIDVASP